MWLLEHFTTNSFRYESNLYVWVKWNHDLHNAGWGSYGQLGRLHTKGFHYLDDYIIHLSFNSSLLTLAGGAGERCWKRWRRRRVHQRGRWSHGEEAGRWGGDVLQVSQCFSYSKQMCTVMSWPRPVYLHLRRKEQEQLAALKQHHQEEIDHHKKEIERLQREIDRHKGKIRKLKHDDWGKQTFPNDDTQPISPATWFSVIIPCLL